MEDDQASHHSVHDAATRPLFARGGQDSVHAPDPGDAEELERDYQLRQPIRKLGADIGQAKPLPVLRVHPVVDCFQGQAGKEEKQGRAQIQDGGVQALATGAASIALEEDKEWAHGDEEAHCQDGKKT